MDVGWLDGKGNNAHPGMQKLTHLNIKTSASIPCRGQLEPFETDRSAGHSPDSALEFLDNTDLCGECQA